MIFNLFFPLRFIELLKTCSKSEFKEIFDHVTTSTNNWSYVPCQQELFLAPDKKSNRISTCLKMYTAMIHLNSSSKLPVMKQIMSIFVKENVILAVRKNAIKILDEDSNAFLKPIVDHLVYDFLLKRQDKYVQC